MDSKTRTTLDNAGQATRHIIIYNDDTLSLDEIEYIAIKISQCVSLESLTISGCQLTTAKGERIAEAIAKHPSLSKIDLSKNNFQSPVFATRILRGAKKIHTLNLSGNRSRFEGEHFVNFLVAVQKTDSLAVLYLPTDPYDTTPWNNSAIESFVAGCKNLIELRLDSTNDDRSRIISEACRRNAQEAAHLLGMLREQRIESIQAVIALNTRLPAVICLAEQTGTRRDVINLLKTLNQKALNQFGMSLGLELYTRETDLGAPSLPVAPKVLKPVAVELPKIDTVIAQIPEEQTPETIRGILAEGRTNPMRIMDVGQELVGAISGISLASLHASTLAMSMEAPVRSMADFLLALTEAKQIIADIKTAPPPLVVSQTIVPPARKSSWLRLPFSRGNEERAHKGEDTPSEKKLRTLADAGVLAKKAGEILQDMIPVLSGMEGRLAEQISTTHSIVTAYRRVEAELRQICSTGTEVLEEWRAEAVNALTPGSAVDPNDPDRFHEQSLASRLEFLSNIKTQVEGHIAGHLIHAAIEQRQQQGVTGLRGQNLPLLAEHISKFMREVEMLQRAGVIQSMADVTRSAARSENETATLAAIQTLGAIESLVGSTRDALSDMSQAAEKLAARTGVNLAGEPKPPLAALPVREQSLDANS